MKLKKYLVEYTEKEFKGFKFQLFDSAKNAQKWIANKNGIYWSQIRKTAPASEWSKPLIADSFDLSKYKRIDGILEIFHETGMECVALVINDPKIHGTEKNPNFDPTKPESPSNFEYFSSYEALHFLKDGDILQLPNSKKIKLIKDSRFAQDDGYRLNFYPEGFSREELVRLFWPGTIQATVWTKNK